jgi:MFS family permease
MGVALADYKFTIFLLLLGFFFWLPFWCFFNICPLYVDSNIDTAQLYVNVRNVLGIFGDTVADLIAGVVSDTDEEGVSRVLGETISHTGLIIMVFQFLVSWFFERFRAIPTFLFGLVVAVVGFVILGYARVGAPSFIFLGILLFAVGEMVASPRIQEYITWIAPKEKAGLYMGMNFLSVMVGAGLSGVTYTWLYGVLTDMGHPDYVWYALAAHTLLGTILVYIFTKTAGEFKEQTQ